MQVISQDHYTTEVAYGPGAFTYTKDNVGTRYVYIHYRNLADRKRRKTSRSQTPFRTR
jgi:para-nitrobenzyl esterase